ncbi:glycosyltransferase [Rhodohalobacter mucosus]|uniref:MGT family glycosyltransferase n=1 Tax=Rhodohalobacter mucosus TaxID=2079485 RepID=A0A316TXF3_9BACT|nr:glycosyltransferase [Rhodohalobacter mucosus]PWN07332.1 hypothetical protein DDZ15_03440 [Rhodohalobacter mucosus]
MKTVLIYTSPARGHLYPMMDVAIELRNEGYEVIVQTLSSEKDHVESEGIQFAPISPDIESLHLQDYRENNPISQIRSAFKSWLSRAPYEIEDLRTSCNEFNPDLLIVDVNTWGAGAYAEARGNPWVMFMPYCLPIFSDDTPAFGPGFAPPTNFLHRFRDRVVDGLIQKAVKSIIDELNNVRSSLHVPRLEKYEDIFFRPDLVLYRTAEPFDYPRKDFPDNILSIGPGLWAPPGNKPEWIEDLPSPKILVSISTEMQDDGAIIETALRATSGREGSVIVTTSAFDPDRFNASRNNVHITKFLPHAQVIPEMDLVITHGGMGTTQRALSAGVPVCVVPWGRDQNETARRVEVSGAGVMLSKNRLNKKRLGKAIQEAMNCSEGAKEIAQAFKRAGGAKRAVKAIADLHPVQSVEK